MQFYILMIDYGRDGREAIVNPEETRRGIVSEVRTILAEGRKGIAFVKFVDGDSIEDITQEIIHEAQDALAMDATE